MKSQSIDLLSIGGGLGRGFSIKMLDVLLKGRNSLSAEAQERITEYIRSQMVDDAFFVGKNRQRDVYYTAFGLMLCYVFGVQVNCVEARAQLEAYKPDERNLIHYAAYMRSVLILKLLDGKKAGIILSRLFSSEAKTLPPFTEYPHGDEYSPYSVFMMLSLKEEVGIKVEDKKAVLERLDLYRVENGGYSNVAGEMSATANATAAALSVKWQLESNKGRSVSHEVGEDLELLCRMQDDSGGFYATCLSPVPDILSTATALFVLSCYKKHPIVESEAFIEAHWLDSGGFAPTLLENESDIEYTFYGILALGAALKHDK